jgi:hypothetical protein
MAQRRDKSGSRGRFDSRQAPFCNFITFFVRGPKKLPFAYKGFIDLHAIRRSSSLGAGFPRAFWTLR